MFTLFRRKKTRELEKKIIELKTRIDNMKKRIDWYEEERTKKRMAQQ